MLGFSDAQHAEYDPYASRLFISALACSLVGRTLSIDIIPGTLAHRVYGGNRVEERYYCNFGLNREHRSALEQAGLATSGIEAGDASSPDEVRILEVPSHPFYLPHSLFASLSHKLSGLTRY